MAVLGFSAAGVFSAGLLTYVGLALFTVIDVWFRADKSNQDLRQQLRFEQAQAPGLDLALHRDSLDTVPVYPFSC